ncbi:hypothetical protein FE257_005856 [Aspergillus nanangensis]|uniref:Uncharacterized protein n=1 Tax=Aspergillus nanangensis TaxID=2582783 RepID=A0AAD4CPU4_ASPNN|nr:hypothetical protein FE257_005856 [Aspergillus nanangensis]
MDAASLIVTPFQGPTEALESFRSHLAGVTSETQAFISTDNLLRGVNSGAIKPNIFLIWLCLVHSKFPSVLRRALHHESSRGVRHAGMRALRTAMKSDRWRESGWDAAGGATGLKDIFQKLSMNEVKPLATALGVWSVSWGPSKSQAVDKLLQLLVPEFLGIPSSHERSRRRFNAISLVPLFRVSSDATLLRVFSKDYPYPQVFLHTLIPPLLNSRMALLRGVITGSVPAHAEIRDLLIISYAHRILASNEPYECQKCPDIPSMAPALGILVDIISYLQENDPQGKKVPQSLLKSSFPQTCLDAVSRFPAERHREEMHPSRPQPAHKVSLEKLLRRAFETVQNPNLKSYLRAGFCGIVSDARLPLLKVVCKHLPGVDIDLDQATPSEKEKQLLPLTIDFFRQFPAKDAMWLFDRVCYLSPMEKVIDFIPTVGPPKAVDDTSWKERLFRVEFESINQYDIAASNSPTHRQIKERAVKSRDGGDRLQWAKLAVHVAVLSKSLHILRDVILWTSRFSHDPFVRPELSRDMYATNVASVLSCADLSIHRQSSLEGLVNDVRIADSVLSHLVETAVLGLQEPWYRPHQDEGIGRLFNSVVFQRIRAVRPLYRLRLGNEKAIVQALFAQLMPILLEYQKLGITEGYDRLGWSNVIGPLSFFPKIRAPGLEVLKLLDSLAQQRDQMFAEERLRRKPLTASLPEGLPRGLPIQSLLPSLEWVVAVMDRLGSGSFVANRVIDVLFCAPTVLLQEVADKDQCIGSFVDSLEYAFDAYIGKGPSSDQSARLLKLWNHYSEHIPASAGHVNPFRRRFANMARARDLRTAVRIIDPPQLPSLDIFQNMSDNIESFEWDPRSHDPSPQSPGAWEDTLLCHRFHRSRWQGDLETCLLDFVHPKPWEPTKINAFNIWEPNHGARRLSHQHKEALILSALLFLDSIASHPNRLFSQPFPEAGGALRYPSVHLDYEFLASINNQGAAAYAALSLLRGLLGIVPPALLSQLSLSMLETLVQLERNSPKFWVVQRCAFETLRLLRASDRPEMASSLALKVIAMFPQDSSWHRMAFPSDLGRGLLRKTAENTLEQFASYVIEAVQGQKQSSNKGENPRDKVVIKITTIKMLVEMLGDSKFGVSVVFATGTLKTLYQGCHHIDVRVAICRALLEMIEKNEDSETILETYNSFKSFASMACGPSEITWSGAWLDPQVTSDILPTVDDERPLLEIFIRTARIKLPSRYYEDYVNSTVLPLVNESARQHNIWMWRLLSQLNVTSDESPATDFGPFEGDLVDTVLKTWADYLPRQFILQHRSWALQYLNCPKVENINDKLAEQDPRWRMTDAGRHWMSFFCRHHRTTAYKTLPSLIKSKRTPEVANGITNEAIGEELVERAAIVLRNPIQFSPDGAKVSFEPFEEVLSALQYTDGGERWRTYILPVAERVLADANGLRTEAWARDPNRSPPVLPPRLRLQTFFFPFPYLNKSDTSFWYETFGSRVVALIEETALSPACIADIRFLQDAVQRVGVDDLLPCAAELGGKYESSVHPIAQYLRVTMAQTLIQKYRRCKRSGDEVDERVKQLVSHWKNSPNEWIRNMAQQFPGGCPM